MRDLSLVLHLVHVFAFFYYIPFWRIKNTTQLYILAASLDLLILQASPLICTLVLTFDITTPLSVPTQLDTMLMLKSYLPKLTESEFHCFLVGAHSTLAGFAFGIFVLFGVWISALQTRTCTVTNCNNLLCLVLFFVPGILLSTAE